MGESVGSFSFWGIKERLGQKTRRFVLKDGCRVIGIKKMICHVYEQKQRPIDSIFLTLCAQNDNTFFLIEGPFLAFNVTQSLSLNSA